MAYKTLYRVYRPQRFDEVAGQEHIITTLRHKEYCAGQKH